MSKNKEKSVTYAKSESGFGPNGEQFSFKSATYKIATEEDYVKIYSSGMHYLSDIPSDCWKLLTILLPYMTFAERPDSPTYRYSMTIIISADLKKRITEQMNYKSVNAVSNLITELTDSGILKRLARSIYRVNPYIFGRGEFRDVVMLREQKEFAFRHDTTFMKVCTINKDIRKHKRKLKKARITNSAPITE